MILYIDSSDKEKVILSVKSGGEEIARAVFNARYSQAEKLLPAIDKLLAGKPSSADPVSVVIAAKGVATAGKKMSLGDIREIQIINYGQSFTALRIGAVTANALGYALEVPVVGSEPSSAEATVGKHENTKTRGDFDVVRPVYDREPNIT